MYYEDLGKSQSFNIISICVVYIYTQHIYLQTSDNFNYDPRGSGPCGVCRCVSYRAGGVFTRCA